MSFISNLIGGRQKIPTPPPTPPQIGDAGGEAEARRRRAQLQNRYGIDDTILSSGGTLGNRPNVPPPNVKTKTLLG